jgi:hypothetical protein
VDTVEHWWNGRKGGLERRDVFLRHNPAGLWEVERRECGDSRYAEFGAEAHARAVVHKLTERGDWMRVEERG